MSGEAISSSILLIGAAVGAAFLVVAILPVIFSAGDTFGTVSSTVDSKMRTDFQIINTYADDDPDAVTIWIKNTGSNRISLYDIAQSTIFLGTNDNIEAYSYSSTEADPYTFRYTAIAGQYLNIGSTLEIIINTPPAIGANDVLYLSLSLPNSIRRTVTFGVTRYS